MKVKELINSCQNQWIKGLTYNPLFTIIFKFKDCENIEKYKIKEWNKMNPTDKRHNQDVLAWQMLGINDIIILVKEL